MAKKTSSNPMGPTRPPRPTPRSIPGSELHTDQLDTASLVISQTPTTEQPAAMLTSSTRNSRPRSVNASVDLAASQSSTPRRTIRCYLCGCTQEVSLKTLSTTCPSCHKAIMVEDVVIKSYVPVNDLQTCGHITVTKKGRVVAKRVQAGAGLTCEGVVEASIEVAGPVELGAKSSWKGRELRTPSLRIEEGASLDGRVQVPWDPASNQDDSRR